MTNVSASLLPASSIPRYASVFSRRSHSASVVSPSAGTSVGRSTWQSAAFTTLRGSAYRGAVDVISRKLPVAPADATSRGAHSLLCVSPAKLGITAFSCLLAFVLLASAVAHGRAPIGFEETAIRWLGSPSDMGRWTAVADFLAVPAISAVLVVSLALGYFSRGFLRVTVYAAFATAALLISENLGKPLVQRTYHGFLTYPSGHVTAVSATALAMWLALYPLTGKRVRSVMLVLSIAWILCMSLAVVGAQWHTPLDAVGSILLSVGVVTAGAAVFEPAGTRRPFIKAQHARIGRRGSG
jgi:membrane-associated phospholipid phosphatase